MPIHYFLINIFLFSTSIFGVNLQSGIPIKPSEYDILQINTHQNLKAIERARTNEEREQIYKKAIEEIETFEIPTRFKPFEKEEMTQRIKQNLKDELAEQLRLYNKHPRWWLGILKLLGRVPLYIK